MISLFDLLSLLSVPGVGNRRARDLVQKFGNPGSVLKAELADLCRTGIVDEKTARSIKDVNPHIAEKQISAAEKSGVALITIWDQQYPDLLKKIHDPPVLLFLKGNADFNHKQMIAMVGTRFPSPYGKRMAETLASALAEQNITVVSGMARGIDTCAHRGALDRGGKTMAVLGCGVNVVYPPENVKIYERIQKQGLLISEFLLDQQPHAGHFPRRNRIISGLSLGTVVIEAGEKSGALITAYMALEQGREVFALPGQVGLKNSQGPHRLIKEGAKLIESVEDILDEFPQFQSKIQCARQEHILQELTDGEKRIWEALSYEPKHIDVITAEVNLTSSVVLAQLLSMELKNCIRQISGMMFLRQ